MKVSFLPNHDLLTFLPQKKITAELDKTEYCRFVIVVLREFTQE
jgi:hypothetical protein